MSRFFIIESSIERAREVALTLTELAPESVCALTLAADVALHLDRDDQLASSLVDRALTLTDEVDDRGLLADYLVRLGRAADALAIVEELHLDDPENEDLEATRAAALTLAWQRAAGDADDEDVRPAECPCWSGRPWLECCQPAEAAAVERFEDRTDLTSLRFAIERYVDSEQALRAAVADDVRRCPEAASVAGEPVADLDEVRRIAAEHAWLMGIEDRDPEPGQRFDPDSTLALFARDPATPSRQAVMARRCLESCSSASGKSGSRSRNRAYGSLSSSPACRGTPRSRPNCWRARAAGACFSAGSSPSMERGDREPECSYCDLARPTRPPISLGS